MSPQDFPFTLPRPVPSSASAPALSLPIVPGVGKGQASTVLQRVGKVGQRGADTFPELPLIKEMAPLASYTAAKQELRQSSQGTCATPFCQVEP